ncbi:dynein regulatory complex protein 12 [Heptranchias perlo]|uniref:dynein regulatory complex protein 12 n=1 Tax=Heptranchias perlo TaxID=212740 RepID=UPI003559C8BB
MPPKKGKAKKGKKKAAEGDNIEEKYTRTVHQVESLKDQLVLRRDIARQALLVKEEWKAKLQVLKNDLNEEQDVKKSIHSDMTRQYKTMRSELDLRVHRLEIEVNRLQQELTSCQQQLARVQEEKVQIIEEKDSTIKELQRKIDNMETEYEIILHDSLDLLLTKLEAAKRQWEKAATSLHSEHKGKLLEFGLNPLEI